MLKFINSINLTEIHEIIAYLKRCNIIKKRPTNSSMKTGSQLSELQLAAWRELDMTIDKHGIDNLSVVYSFFLKDADFVKN